MTKKELLYAIKEANIAYYEKDSPIITDAEYDKLYDEYKEKYGTVDLDFVPGNINIGFVSFTHTEPVSSLDKVKEGEDERLKAIVHKLWPCVVEPKLDGLTVVAYPDENGHCTFVTRGNGIQGEILPNFISKYEEKDMNNTGYPVRGEVFLSPENFEEINRILESEGKPTFSNPRNAAAGILRKKERSRFIDKLSYVCYDILGLDLGESEKIALLDIQTSFDIISAWLFNTEEELVSSMRTIYQKELDMNNYPIDGLVIKTEQENSLQKYGRTGHHPNNAVAWKVEQIGVVTTLKDIEWQVGRKYITPVAILDPVEIAGSIVSKASVHNPAIIRKLNLHKGDKIKLIKANEIIPQIVGVEETCGGAAMNIPIFCPSCNSKLEYDNDKIYCPNSRCNEKLAQTMAYIGSKKILNIDGLSIETCRKIIANDTEKKIKHPLSVLTLEEKDIIGLEGFAKKSTSNLINAIKEAKKSVSIDKYIASISFPGISITVGTALMKEGKTFGGVLKLLHDKNALLEIEGIGKVVSDILSSMDFINSYNDCFEYFEKIEAYTIKDEKNIPEKVLSFALTGTMLMPRAFYEAMINNAGHKISKSVTKKTDYLIIADINSQTSKAKKARELGVKLISPEDVTDMLLKI